MWRTAYEGPEVKKSMMICFWRPIQMNEALKDTPLALLSRKSVAAGDPVIRELYGQSAVKELPIITQQLRKNASHKWYFYPDMSVNEVIAMTQFCLEKGVEPTECQSVFHTAFNDPTTPEGAEKRKSCEYRVPLLIK